MGPPGQAKDVARLDARSRPGEPGTPHGLCTRARQLGPARELKPVRRSDGRAGSTTCLFQQLPTPQKTPGARATSSSASSRRSRSPVTGSRLTAGRSFSPTTSETACANGASRSDRSGLDRRTSTARSSGSSGPCSRSSGRPSTSPEPTSPTDSPNGRPSTTDSNLTTRSAAEPLSTASASSAPGRRSVRASPSPTTPAKSSFASTTTAALNLLAIETLTADHTSPDRRHSPAKERAGSCQP